MITTINHTSFAYARRVMSLPLLFVLCIACSRNVDEVSNDNQRNMFSLQKQLNGKNTKSEVEPAFPGGAGGWMRFLNKNFRYPDEAVEKEIQGTVVVLFMVDKAGNVSDVKALSGPSVLQIEAVRVISLSKWIPAKMNGRIVKAYKKQPVTFRLSSE